MKPTDIIRTLKAFNQDSATSPKTKMVVFAAIETIIGKHKIAKVETASVGRPRIVTTRPPTKNEVAARARMVGEAYKQRLATKLAAQVEAAELRKPKQRQPARRKEVIGMK